MLKLAYPPEQLLIVSLDVTETTQIDNAFDATRKHFGCLDVVVNNAWYGIQGEIEATPDVEARRMMETLFCGPVRVTQQVRSIQVQIQCLQCLTKLLQCFLLSACADHISANTYPFFLVLIPFERCAS